MDGKWVSASWLSNNTNVDGRMFSLWQPTGGFKGQVCSLAYELAAPGTDSDRFSLKRTKSELSHMARAVDDSTVNIVLCIITISSSIITGNVAVTYTYCRLVTAKRTQWMAKMSTSRLLFRQLRRSISTCCADRLENYVRKKISVRSRVNSKDEVKITSPALPWSFKSPLSTDLPSQCPSRSGTVYVQIFCSVTTRILASNHV